LDHSGDALEFLGAIRARETEDPNCVFGTFVAELNAGMPHVQRDRFDHIQFVEQPRGGSQLLWCPGRDPVWTECRLEVSSSDAGDSRG
jgi:hypothetical protein